MDACLERFDFPVGGPEHAAPLGCLKQSQWPMASFLSGSIVGNAWLDFKFSIILKVTRVQPPISGEKQKRRLLISSHLPSILPWGSTVFPLASRPSDPFSHSFGRL